MTIQVQQVFNDLAKKDFSSLKQYVEEGGNLNVKGYGFDGHGSASQEMSLAKAVAVTGNAAPLVIFQDLKADPDIKLYAGSLDVVKALESKGLVYENSDLFSQVNNLETLKYLVDQKGLDINTKANDGATLLHSVRANNMDVIKYLVEEKKLDVNAEDQHGNTPVMQMVREIGDKQYYGELKDVSKLSAEAHDLCAYFKAHGADINHLNHGGSGVKDLFVNSESYYEKSAGGFEFPSAMPNSSHFNQEYANDLVQRGVDLDVSDL